MHNKQIQLPHWCGCQFMLIAATVCYEELLNGNQKEFGVSETLAAGVKKKAFWLDYELRG